MSVYVPAKLKVAFNHLEHATKHFASLEAIASEYGNDELAQSMHTLADKTAAISGEVRNAIHRAQDNGLRFGRRKA